MVHASSIEGTLERSLVHAEMVVRGRGASLTPVRRQVLSHLLQARRPVGAYTLLEQIKRPEGRMMPATVYRALDFLMTQGFVHRIESMNAFIACSELDREQGSFHQGMFLICTKCSETMELEELQVAQQLRQASEAVGFVVSHLTVEMRGLCKRCR